MSGGHFDYVQGRIIAVAQDLASEAELWSRPQKPDRFRYWQPDEEIPPLAPDTIEAFRVVARLCELASQAVHDVDWLLSGDIGEDGFRTAAEQWRHALEPDLPRAPT